MTRALVRGEAILTQLLFDHALRLRMKDSTEEDEKSEAKEEAEMTSAIDIRIEEVIDPTDGPLVNLVHEDVNGDVETPQGSSESTEVGKTPSNGAAAEQEAQNPKGHGLAGKINVLMAADVESVLEGETIRRDHDSTDMFQAEIFYWYSCLRQSKSRCASSSSTSSSAGVSVPACRRAVRLISTLGSLVGMATMIATMPIPGLITKKSAEYQQRRMEAVSYMLSSAPRVLAHSPLVRPMFE